MKNKLFLLKRRIKHSYQKIRYGFSNRELWSLDSSISAFILPRLKRFREITCGYPPDFNSLDEWKSALDKMIVAFELAHEPWNIEKEYQDKVSEGLDLFRKYYFSLWC